MIEPDPAYFFSRSQLSFGFRRGRNLGKSGRCQPIFCPALRADQCRVVARRVLSLHNRNGRSPALVSSVKRPYRSSLARREGQAFPTLRRRAGKARPETPCAALAWRGGKAERRLLSMLAPNHDASCGNPRRRLADSKSVGALDNGFSSGLRVGILSARRFSVFLFARRPRE